MKRTEYVAEAANQVRITFAFNSGIRATEAMVREIARAEKQSYEGGKTSRVDNVYRRTWTGKRTGRVVEVSVRENHCRQEDHQRKPDESAVTPA